MKLAEWHVKVKYPRMIARLPMELAWAFRAEDGAKIHFGQYEGAAVCAVERVLWEGVGFDLPKGS